MQYIEHSYQGLVLPSLKWKRAFPSELKLYFTTSPSFFQAHFLSPSSVMFLTWFQKSELDSKYSTPSRWLSENSSLIAVFYVVVKVELLAHHLLSWVTECSKRKWTQKIKSRVMRYRHHWFCRLPYTQFGG